jgi:hypothetical protein
MAWRLYEHVLMIACCFQVCVLFVMYQVLWNVFLHNMMCAVFHQCRRVSQLLNTMHTIQWCVHTIQLVQQ